MNDLFEIETSNIFLSEIDTKKIRVEQFSSGELQKIQPQISKAVWRPAPARKLGFMVFYEDKLLGAAFLASPVINLGPRDLALNLPKDSSLKGKELRHYADLSVCVSTQPFGWHWNGGKLIALLATTFGDFWFDRYGDELKGIITTSLWGKGSQYNRVYKFLGYTKGFGHEHISEECYQEMMSWMRENNIDIPSSRFGAGSNPRMRRIMAYKKASGEKALNLIHGNQRGIYYHPANSPESRQEVIDFWYARWGLPRFERTKDLDAPYSSGLDIKENGV